MADEIKSKIGKINADIFDKFLLKRLGHQDESVIVPPMTGVDAGVIDIGNERVLVVAEDPIFTIPGLPLEMFGWYTVHIGASDVAVMGVKPQYMTYTLLMPPETSDKDFQIIVDSIHQTAKDLEIAIIGGHTGYYPGFSAPTIGELFEIANASGVGMEIDETLFLYPDEVRMVCEAFDIDPLAAIAEGSLLITTNPENSDKIIQKLQEIDILASIVGRVIENPDERTIQRKDGTIEPLFIPDQDPFWPAFFKGLKEEPSYFRR